MSERGFCDSKVPALTQSVSTGPVYQGNASSFLSEPVNSRRPDQSTQQNERVDDGFVQLNMEADYSMDDYYHHHSNRVQEQNLPPETPSLHTKPARDVTKNISVEIGTSLDQLWHRFNRSYSLPESHPINEREVSLLERLERLSRLLHSPTTAKQGDRQLDNSQNRKRDPELTKLPNNEVTTKEKKERNRRVKRLDEVKRLPKTVWEGESLRNSHMFVADVQQSNGHHCTAERDESASVSVETSSSRSTIDTQRLIRAFGPHRVRNVEEKSISKKQTSSSLVKVYNAIHKQKTEHGKADPKHHLVSVATETSSADESRVSLQFRNCNKKYIKP